MPNRPSLHENLYTQLHPGGTFVIEDFASLQPPTAEEATTLVTLVKAPSVTSPAEYLAEVSALELQRLDPARPSLVSVSPRHPSVSPRALRRRVGSCEVWALWTARRST